MSKSDISEISIIYNIDQNYDENEDDEENIKIFGSKFVKNNKSKCKMIIDNKEYDLAEKYKIENNEKLIVKLKGVDNINNISYMF